MKKWKKIIAAGMAVILIPVTGLAVWQKDNLKALYLLLTNDSQSISQNMEDKQQAQQEKLEQDFNIIIQAPTANQNSALLDGKVTPEEVKETLGLVQPETTEPSAAIPEVNKSEPSSNPPLIFEEPKQLTEEERKAQADGLVNRCLTELYALEVDLMAEMGEMKKTALLDWNSRSPDGRTKEKTIEFGFMWLNEVYKVEVRADRTVKEILSRYRGPLEELNADTSVLDDMWRYYCDKKSDTKAYYLNKYLN